MYYLTILYDKRRWYILNVAIKRKVLQINPQIYNFNLLTYSICETQLVPGYIENVIKYYSSLYTPLKLYVELHNNGYNTLDLSQCF